MSSKPALQIQIGWGEQLLRCESFAWGERPRIGACEDVEVPFYGSDFEQPRALASEAKGRWLVHVPESMIAVHTSASDSRALPASERDVCLLPGEHLRLSAENDLWLDVSCVPTQKPLPRAQLVLDAGLLTPLILSALAMSTLVFAPPTQSVSFAESVSQRARVHRLLVKSKAPIVVTKPQVCEHVVSGVLGGMPVPSRQKASTSKPTHPKPLAPLPDLDSKHRPMGAAAAVARLLNRGAALHGLLESAERIHSSTERSFARLANSIRSIAAGSAANAWFPETGGGLRAGPRHYCWRQAQEQAKELSANSKGHGQKSGKASSSSDDVDNADSEESRADASDNHERNERNDVRTKSKSDSQTQSDAKLPTVVDVPAATMTQLRTNEQLWLRDNRPDAKVIHNSVRFFGYHYVDLVTIRLGDGTDEQVSFGGVGGGPGSGAGVGRDRGYDSGFGFGDWAGWRMVPCD